MLHRLLFRPKWQHRNARVRLEGVLELAPGDPRLSDLATGDPDAAVRRQAVRRLNDPAVLDRCRAQDADTSVRDAAQKRLCQALAGEADVGLGATELAAVARDLMDDVLAAYLVKHASSEVIRQTALERIDRHAQLAEVALADPAPELRVAALARIDHLPTLERIARMARGHDKRVARMAREKVELLRADEERPQRQRTICEGLEQLVAAGVPDIVRFHQLETAWSGLADGAPSDLAARVEAATAAFRSLNARHQEAATYLARQRELCERAESLVAEVQVLKAPPAVEIASVRKALEMLEGSWRELVEEAAEEASASCAARFNAAVSLVGRRLPALEAVSVARQGFERLVEQALRAASGQKLPAEKRLRELDAQWDDHLARHRDAMEPGSRERFTTALARARERIKEARDQERALGAEFDQLVDELESALGDGELQHAISVHDKARDRLGKLTAVSPRQGQREKRLHRISAPLRELRDWRRYGVEQVRDELLGRMRALIGSDLAPTRLATEIRGLQEEWRTLDRGSGPAGEDLWNEFNEAARQARKPCDAHFEKLASEQAAHAQARAGFLDEFEAALAQADAEAPDWAALDRKVRAARDGWRELGGVEPRQWRSLDRRFREIVQQFEARLGPERERERRRRELLIRHIEALADETDLGKAIAEVKSAQAAWQPSVPGSRKDEQALWKRFKSAGDAIFSRRDAERAEQHRTAEEQVAARIALCESAEALAAQDPGSWARARHECDALLAAWADLPSSPPRQGAALERRFRSAVAAFRRAEAEAGIRAAQEEERQWEARARLCAELEARLDTEVPPQVCEEAGSRWNELPRLDDEALMAKFEDRFSRICRALGGDAAEREALRSERERCVAQCRQYCLELEIVAGIDSPPEFADDRLALQVERMPRAMMSGGAANETGDDFRSVLKACYLAAPLPRDSGSEILARAARAREAISRAAAVVSR